jgi:signal transduction histidine kinase
VGVATATRGARPRPVHPPDPEQPALAGIMGMAEQVVSDLLAGSATPATVAELVPRPARRDVYALAVRDLRLLTVEPRTAVDAHLRALLLFAPVSHASIWRLGPKGHDRVATTGSGVARDVARRALRHPARNGSAGLRTFPIAGPGGCWGTLLVQVSQAYARSALRYADEAARALAPVVERDLLLEGLSGSAESLQQAADRRTARMAYDLHDGPLQDLTLLVGRLSFLPRELKSAARAGELDSVLEERLRELLGIAMGVADELREIAVNGGGGAGLSLRETLEQQLSHFRRRTDLAATLAVEGDVDRTTPSQRIAAARVVEEALANVREHSRASRVRVAVERHDGLLEVRVADDGRGFDVARAAKRAARDRRLGLIGMRERVRLLGGMLDVSSRPGGPTVVSAFLPAWSPPADR